MTCVRSVGIVHDARTLSPLSGKVHDTSLTGRTLHVLLGLKVEGGTNSGHFAGLLIFVQVVIDVHAGSL